VLFKAALVATIAALAGSPLPARSAEAVSTSPASTGRITVRVNEPGPAISPNLYGIFFEEINHAGDGGLYAELVRNRSFEENDTTAPWTLRPDAPASGAISIIERSDGGQFNRQALEIRVEDPSAGPVGAVNGGYWGMGLVRGRTYDLSIEARGIDGFTGPLTVQLEGPDGAVLAKGATKPVTKDWQRYTVSLKATGTAPEGRLFVGSGRKGTVQVDMVSLFPRDTFKKRPNGLRADLAAMLTGLSPAFVRFPGGCWVEGETMEGAHRWKQTIGPLSERRTQFNLWRYQSTNGLGFHEYLQMSEDLGAEPRFVINCGMSHREVVPMEKMAEYVQDALDAIEYANGPVTSTWGAKRAAAGHPAPFGLKFIEIGNENGGPAYNDRYALFHYAIKSRHPEIRLIANDWSGVPTSRPLDIVDEHYYNSPAFFILNAHKYDSYDRKGPKVYVGEYAVTRGAGEGNLAAAIGEAAFMTGMERNADVVEMSSYAPLFVNTNDRRWNPDLIAFDSSRVYGTPSYHVQQMFSRNRGDVALPISVEGPPRTSGALAQGGIGVGTWETRAEFKDIRVTRGEDTLYAWDPAKGLDGWNARGEGWSVEDGALRQNGVGQRQIALVGDPSWTDYTVTLKARKLSGREGFIVLVRASDPDNWAWFNVGGWQNRRHGFEAGYGGGSFELPGAVPGEVEADRWYDVKVEVAGRRMRAWLDGELVQEAMLPELGSLFASASMANKPGEVVLKVVNVSQWDCETDVELEGARSVRPRASALVLTGNPMDENTLESPLRVAPRPETITNAAPRFRHTFPANSVTVMRIRAAS